MKRKLTFFSLILTLGFTHSICFAQSTTAIPDANFEQALIDLGIDSNGLTGDILNSDAEGVLGSLNISGKSITDLSGIEAFTSITNLNVYGNQLTSLDISNNTQLRTLSCGNNQLTSLDVTKNLVLKSLYCQYNELTGLDLSLNSDLETLQCYNNDLINLDVSNNTKLATLLCDHNQLTSLDLSANTGLTGLNCSGNDLINLDLSVNNLLKNVHVSSNYNLLTLNVKNGNNTNIANFSATNTFSLSCIEVDDPAWSTENWTNITSGTIFSENCNAYVPDDNFEQALIDLGYDVGPLNDYVPIANINTLTSLDISGQNITDLTGIEEFIALEMLSCQNNQLSSLDLTQNIVLTQLNCSGNQLTSLDIKNGNNSNFTSFDATNNSSLSCIQVDDAIWSAANWTNIDESSGFGADCSLFGVNTYIPDDNFEQALINLGYDDVLDDQVATANINTLSSLSVMNESIADLTGIEDFTALTSLICFGNDLTSIDVSNNTLLKTLFCHSNQLTSLDVTSNTELTNLKCNNNNLTNIDVSQNTLLSSLSVEGNLLTTLDISNNLDLTSLTCQNNNLGSLDISSNTLITTLYCQNNQLVRLNVKNGNNTNFSFFNASNNPDLTCIEVDDAAYSTTNWTDIDLQTSFSEDCQFDDDGDGVTNEQEALDGTDPQDGCLYLTANQTIENVSSEWNLQDCDCDGITNEDEILAGDSPLPSPPSGSSEQVFCLRDNPTISDLVVAGEGIKWYDDFDSMTPLDEQTSLIDGTSYFASQKVGSCYESGRLEVYVTLTNTEVPTGSTSQSFCAKDQPTISDLSTSGSNIQWYNSAVEGNPLAAHAELRSGKYYATQTINDCESEKLEVEVTLTEVDRPSGLLTQTFCLTDDPKVADLDISGTNIRWYSSETGSETIDTQTNLENGTYYAASSSDECESDRLAINVVIEGCNEVTGIENQSVISVYPTVTTGDVRIELSKPYIELDVKVFNLQGKAEKVSLTYLDSTIHLNISGAPGLYVVEIITNQLDRNLLRVMKK